METWGVTHSGKVRAVNQDVYKIIADKLNGFAVLTVCDGMGGANAGNVASSMAAEVFTEFINENLLRILPQSSASKPGTDNDIYIANKESLLESIADIVTEASVIANMAVFEKSFTDPECSGMGTTLVALVSADAGEVVINIGDSRAYHITPNGISQITKDHSVVEEMIDRGEITLEQSINHPRRNLITRAVGADDFIEPDVYTQNIDIGDIVLLCTDGLTNLVTENEILDELVNSETLGDACDLLLEKALTRGAPDNVTVAVFRK